MDKDRGERGGGEEVENTHVEETVGETPAEEERGDEDVREDCRAREACMRLAWDAIDEQSRRGRTDHSSWA
jgi:hypothetical protein